MAQKAARAEFDKARDNRPRGLRLDDRKRSGGHLVAIDSEGANFGAPVKRGAAEYQPHRSILWMAGGAEGFKDVELRPAPRQTMALVRGDLLSTHENSQKLS